VVERPAAQRPPVDALGEERSLVDQARTALARRAPDDALTALGEHRRRFPRGQLAEERLALEVVALVAAGQGEEARTRASEFRSTYPASLLSPLVDGASPAP
jgi:hypothetical protein